MIWERGVRRLGGLTRPANPISRTEPAAPSMRIAMRIRIAQRRRPAAAPIAVSPRAIRADSRGQAGPPQ